MEIIEQTIEGTDLKITVDSNEESLFSLLKAYMEPMADVEVVGHFKGHHLVDKTEFYLKVKKGDALKIFKKALATVKKDLASKKVK
jgi:DNA-directed RNA polymerase subunit L